MGKESSEKGTLYPGCMGSFMHFFDINQRLGARKLLTDKRNGGGGGEGSSDSKNKMGDPQTIQEKVGYEVVASKSKKNAKKSSTPIKALIAEELSKEPESKSRSPSVVARLMGLDALPPSEQNHQISSYNHNTMSEAEESRALPRDRKWNSTENSAGNGHRFPHRNSAKNSAENSTENSFESGHVFPQWNPNTDTLTGLDSWSSDRLRELPPPQPPPPDARQMLLREKLNQVKLAHEKFMVMRHNCEPHELPYESAMEYQDAMEFLQSNKELFSKFVHQSDSSLTRPVTKLPPRSIKQNGAEKQPDSYLSRRKASSPVYPKNDPPETRGRRKDPFTPKKRQDAEIVPERRGVSRRPAMVATTSSGGDAFSPFDGYNTEVPYTGNRVPTRIVVLKPSLGKVADGAFSTSNGYSLSPTALSGMRENQSDSWAGDFRKESKGMNNGGWDFARSSDYGYGYGYGYPSGEGIEDPGEIAREIARQVRESVSRDLAMDSGRRSTLHMGRQSSPFTRLGSESLFSSDGESSAPSTKLFRNHDDKPIRHSRTRDLRVYGAKDERKVYDDENSSRSSYLQRKIAPQEESRQSIVHLRGGSAGHSSKVQGRNMVDGTLGKSDNSTKWETGSDCERSTKSGDEGKNGSRALLRSRSLPAGERNYKEHQTRKSVTHSTNNSVQASVLLDASRTKDENPPRSRMGKKVYGLKGGSASSLKKKRPLGKLPSDPMPFENDQCDLPECIKDVIHATISDSHSTTAIPPLALDDASKEDTGDDIKVLECLDKPDVSANIPGSLKSTTNLPLCDLELKDSEQESGDINRGLKSSDHSSQNYPATPCSSIVGRLPSPAGEKENQPSPVSVLDCPFSEDATTPVNFKELRSDLQELRLQLHLCKFDNSEVNQGDCSIIEDQASMKVDRNMEEYPRSLETEEAEEEEEEEEEEDEDEEEEEEEASVSYVKRLLRISGLTGEGVALFSKWYMPNEPLDPYLFTIMEDSYNHKQASLVSEAGGNQEILDKPTRQLLFDCVNKVILDLLDPYLNCKQWVKPLTRASISRMPTGNELVNHVLTEIDHLSYLHSDSQETLESLVAIDLTKEGCAWIESMDNAESVGIQVENAILGELLEDLLSCLCQ